MNNCRSLDLINLSRDAVSSFIYTLVVLIAGHRLHSDAAYSHKTSMITESRLAANNPTEPKTKKGAVGFVLVHLMQSSNLSSVLLHA
jgi:hypothetical protein